MKRRHYRPEKRAHQKNNTCISNYAKGVVVSRNFVVWYDSKGQWYIPGKNNDSRRFLPLDKRRSLINGDIRDEASLLQVVTPPIAEIA
jgi:hypothetical protein